MSFPTAAPNPPSSPPLCSPAPPVPAGPPGAVGPRRPPWRRRSPAQPIPATRVFSPASSPALASPPLSSTLAPPALYSALAPPALSSVLLPGVAVLLPSSSLQPSKLGYLLASQEPSFSTASNPCSQVWR
ncbi:hypothetical protein ABZP36_027470 [Zizania latifolia]